MSQIMDDLRMSVQRMIAKNMIKKGSISFEDISEYTGIPLSEIIKLAREESA